MFRANCWPSWSPGRVKRVDAAPLIQRHLGDDVGRTTESVNAQALPLTRADERTVSDQSRAKQWSCFDIRIHFRNRDAESFVRNREIGVAAVEGVAGEPRLHAKIFSARAAVRTYFVGPAKPGHAHALSDAQTRHTFAQSRHLANNLVAEDQWKLRIGQFAVNDVQIGAADGARVNFEPHLPGTRLRHRALAEYKWMPNLFQNHRAHELIIAQ